MQPMIAESSPASLRAEAFRWRLVDNLFRRWFLYLIPVAVAVVLGLTQAGDVTAVYRSTGTLSTSTNPLLPEQQIAVAAPGFYETPAQTTSRTINEQLGTDSFLLAVVERTQLSEWVEVGAVRLDDVRGNVRATATGDAIVSVEAQWDDGPIAAELAQSTIVLYQELLNESVTGDALAAERFYTERYTTLQANRDAALDALESFVADLPPLPARGERLPSYEIELQRRTAEVEALEQQMRSASFEIDNARLTQSQQLSEVGRSLKVIDAPAIPLAPGSARLERLSFLIAYTLIGVVVAAVALLLTTAVDRSVTSTVDLFALVGSGAVATIPVMKMPGHVRRRRWWRRR